MSLESPPSDLEARPVPNRRDALPLWVIVLLVVFAGMRIYEVGVAPWLAKRAATLSTERGLDTDSMQDLIEADLQAKFAYVASLALPGPVVKPKKETLRAALTFAERLQRETDNAPSAARRVILLRALLSLPPLAAGKKGLDPRAAFGRALPADLPPVDRRRYVDEGRVWATAFAGKPLTARQTDSLAARIRAMPHLRWWTYPALAALYQAQGDLSEANRYAEQARARTITTLIPVTVVGLWRIGLMLLGVLLLVYFVVRAVARHRPAADHPFPDFWPTLPDSIPPAERRLGAGDLMGVFVIYLLTREVIELALVGFPGLGARHLLAFPGTLTRFLPRLEALPAAERGTLGVSLEAVIYLVSAVPPVACLLALARRRGASLADEIGWNRRRFGPNLLYGVGGYAVALPLIRLIAKIAPQIFKHAPSPSNPVIPQLINSSGFWVPLILILLATVAAPLVEELLFRGVFYNAARLRLGVWPAIVLTGLVFGFVHPVGIAEMLAIAMLGGVFAWMAETRKSLVPSIFAHGLNNLTTTLLLLFVLAG